MSKAEHAQNEALQRRVENLEAELSRVRRVAKERSVVASNRSMEITELRGSLSRVEQALDSPPKETNYVPLQTPGPTPMQSLSQQQQQQRVHINRTGSVSFNAGSAFRVRSFSDSNESGPIRATPLLGSTTNSGPVQVHVSRRGSIDISSSTPLRSTTNNRGGPSPAAQRVRERLANVRAQFASLKS